MPRFQNFTLKEFCASETATRRRIDNTPDFDEVLHAVELIDKILQPLRTAWAQADGKGSGLRITSGYRCAVLNKAVGGVSNSAHLAGFAADVQPINGKLEEFIVFAEQWLRANGVAFDQSIREKSGKAEWWHIGIRDRYGRQRRQYLAIDKGTGTTRHLEYTG